MSSAARGPSRSCARSTRASRPSRPKGGGDALVTYLRRFVVLGDVVERDLFGVSELPTLDGLTLAVEAANGRVLLGGSRLLFGDQRGRNGTVHVVHPAWPR